jgi:hypothetical protein
LSIINKSGNEKPSFVNNLYLWVIVWFKSETKGKFDASKLLDYILIIDNRNVRMCPSIEILDISIDKK